MAIRTQARWLSRACNQGCWKNTASIPERQRLHRQISRDRERPQQKTAAVARQSPMSRWTAWNRLSSGLPVFRKLSTVAHECGLMCGSGFTVVLYVIATVIQAIASLLTCASGLMSIEGVHLSCVPIRHYQRRTVGCDPQPPANASSHLLNVPACRQSSALITASAAPTCGLLLVSSKMKGPHRTSHLRLSNLGASISDQR